MKLVVIEDGSNVAAELWAIQDRVASSILSYPEGRAALAAARRAARLTGDGHAMAVADFDDVQRDLLIISVDEPLAVHAGELAEQLGLRGYDAVHLASAIALGSGSGSGSVTLVTWDRDLSRAAQRQGLGIAPVI